MTAAATRASSHAIDAARPDRLLLGLIGSGIQKSRSPAQHEGEAAALGLRCLYQLIDLERLGLGPESLPDLLTAAERLGFAGLNITFPCKQAVIPHLTALSEDARALGAVNTVVFAGGERVGHNTDWLGYAHAFRDGLSGVALDDVVLFGAGGAGVAVAYALLTLGVKRLTVVDTDDERAHRLVAQMTASFGNCLVSVAADVEAAVASADGIVNASPIGMIGFAGMPFPAAWLRAGHWVSEVVYFPLETELLATARALGCRTLDGSGMNVLQAAEAFRLFSGREPDAARMRAHFDGARD